MSEQVLETVSVRKHFPVNKGLFRKTLSVKAVDDVSLGIPAGKTLGLVGESGSGKTTITRLLLLLETPTAGSVRFRGDETGEFDAQAMRRFRKSVQPVFQNPYSSLDPRMRVIRIIAEPLQVTSGLSRSRIADKAAEAIEKVGLSTSDLQKYPHEFSGGQRQRIAIARALASDPDVIILDEAVSSQDISIQAHILNLLKDLQADEGIAYLFVAHDLATVRYMSDRVAVMYLGRIVESADSEELYHNPQHPYTQALMAACLTHDAEPSATPVRVLGEVPSPLDPPSGCHFHPRCPHARPECRTQPPPEVETAPGHRVACVLYT